MSPEVKMSCEEVRGLLSEYADRELAEDEVRHIDHHLRTCRNCALESTIILNLKKFIEGWDGVRAEEDFEKKVLERAKSAPRGGSPFSVHLLALVGAVLVACGTVLWAFHVRRKRQSWAELGPAVAAREREPEAPAKPEVGPEPGVGPEEPVRELAAGPVPRAPAREEPAPAQKKPEPPAEKPEPGPEPARKGGGARPAEKTEPGGLGKAISAGEGGAVVRGGKELNAEGPVLAGDSFRGQILIEMADGLLIKARKEAEFSTAAPGANGEVKAGCVVFDYSKAKPLAGVYKVRAGDMLVSMRKKDVVCAVERRRDGSTKVSVLKDTVGLRCPRQRGKPINIGLKEGRSITLKSDGTLVGPEPSIDKRLFE